jgi:multidrug efflux pump subunit AcrA (membrane-fusion protein)
VSKPDVRALSTVSAVGRLAIGVGIFALPGRVLPALGFGAADETGLTLARLAAVRDVVLACVTLLALDDSDRLRAASLANAAADGGDALNFALALRQTERNPAARRGIAAALPATAAGLWVFWRLRD